MRRDEYPKTLNSTYDLAIKWKGNIKVIGVTPNDGVVFTTEADEGDIHATDGVKMTRTGNPVICHICGKNHYANRCPDREDSTQGKMKLKLRIPQEQEVHQRKHQSILQLEKIGGTTPTMLA